MGLVVPLKNPQFFNFVNFVVKTAVGQSLFQISVFHWNLEL